MATNRPTGYGLSRELAEKNAAKYSLDDEVRDFYGFCRQIFKVKLKHVLWVNCK